MKRFAIAILALLLSASSAICDAGKHNKINPKTETRIVYHEKQIFFGGFWFACGYTWPEWVFEDEVYVTPIGGSVYLLSDFNNPTKQIQIIFVK